MGQYDELEREYQRASVFCTLSDHEGFGVPILEAMAYGIPVVAYDNSAIGDTVGDAGLLLGSKEPDCGGLSSRPSAVR